MRTLIIWWFIASIATATAYVLVRVAGRRERSDPGGRINAITLSPRWAAVGLAAAVILGLALLRGQYTCGLHLCPIGATP